MAEAKRVACLANLKEYCYSDFLLILKCRAIGIGDY